MTRTISHARPVTPGSARMHEELHVAELDAIVGGGLVAPITQQPAGATKTPNLLVVIAIIAILIG